MPLLVTNDHTGNLTVETGPYEKADSRFYQYEFQYFYRTLPNFVIEKVKVKIENNLKYFKII